jgi:hypothetical protein
LHIKTSTKSTLVLLFQTNVCEKGCDNIVSGSWGRDTHPKYTAEASILESGGNCVTRHAYRAATVRSGNYSPICTDFDPVGVLTNAIAAASRTP